LPTLRAERELKLFRDMMAFLVGASGVSRKTRDMGHPIARNL
jgi:hypothetical protein